MFSFRQRSRFRLDNLLYFGCDFYYMQTLRIKTLRNLELSFSSLLLSLSPFWLLRMICYMKFCSPKCYVTYTKCVSLAKYPLMIHCLKCIPSVKTNIQVVLFLTLAAALDTNSTLFKFVIQFCNYFLWLLISPCIEIILLLKTLQKS